MYRYLHTLYTHVPTSTGWLPMDTKGTLSALYSPCHIFMPHFSQHKSDGKRWFSQPFYSAPGGYKLCLCVDANGSVSAKGTHVSVFVSLMKGENDHQLQWPFEHDVLYGVLNWKRDANHVIGMTSFKNAPTKYKARVTSDQRAPQGFGCSQLLSHALLYGSQDEHVQYLNEDCLCLHVLKVEPPK